MGNQTSHKHVRGESIKTNYHSTGGATHPTTSHGIATPGGFVYPGDDFNEDFDEPMLATPYTKNSYSPTDSVPTFKFPSRTESMPINKNNVDTHAQQLPEEKKKIPVVFKYPINKNPNAKDVYLVGTFTNWKDKILMVKSDGDFIAIVDLPEGEHQYKFVVDGKWEHDPSQPCIDDTFCGKNNVAVVKKSDFEVMEALTMDSIQQQAQKSSSKLDDISHSPAGEYTDEIPVRGLNSMSTDKPPYLPPQLLNIVLNKDTSASCEPALLPEPNHVMLKHLYALSIRDGVMVLSSTFRYKQKFITTCFYKPI